MNNKKNYFLKITEKAKCFYFIPHYFDCLQDCLQAIYSNKIQIFYSKPDKEYIKEKTIYYESNKPLQKITAQAKIYTSQPWM